MRKQRIPTNDGNSRQERALMALDILEHVQSSTDGVLYKFDMLKATRLIDLLDGETTNEGLLTTEDDPSGR